MSRVAPTSTRGVALQAVGQAMYSESLWPQLSDALVAAQQGDGAGLLAALRRLLPAPARTARGATSSRRSSRSRAWTTPSGSASRRTTPPRSEFHEVGPRFAPGTTGSYFCTFFPPSTDPRVDITGAGAGPIVVIGTTGDAATPLASTRAMADTLEDGRLVVVTADQHTGYGVNDCVDQVVHDYLVDLVDPPEETDC